MPSSDSSQRVSSALGDFFAQLIPIARNIKDSDSFESQLRQHMSEQGLDTLASHITNCTCWRSAIAEMAHSIGTMTPSKYKVTDPLKVQRVVCTCGQNVPKTTGGTDTKVASGKATAGRASSADECSEKTHGVWEIHEVTDDHQWHLFHPGLDVAGHIQALARRADGRMLGMTLTQYLHFKTNAPGHLKALVDGAATQVEAQNTAKYEDQLAIKRCDDCGRFCNASKKSDKTKKQAETTTPGCDSDQKQPEDETKVGETETDPLKKKSTAVPKVPSVSYSNTKEVVRLDPPCYCRTCSESHWLSGGFLEVKDNQEPVSDIPKMVSIIDTARFHIAGALRAHEHTLRRRWKKKKPSQREAIMRRAADGDLLTYRMIAALLGDFYPRAKPGRPPLRKEVNIFAVSLVMEDLVNDCHLLFDHLKARSSMHPSKFFLSDLVHTRNLRELLRTCSNFYPGSIGITENSYGIWEEWNDTRIHQFQSVVATVAPEVFVAQCKTYHLLSKLVSELLDGLDRPISMGALDIEDLESTEPPFPLPTISDARSIFCGARPPQTNLSDVRELVDKKVAAALFDLQLLRSDNKVFLQRIGGCKEFFNFSRIPNMPEEAHDALHAHHILGEPHDRIAMWLLIKAQTSTLMEASESKEEDRLQYTSDFRTLICMLRQRCQWIMYFAYDLCTHTIKPSSLVPTGLTNNQAWVSEWLIKYFLGYLMSGSQPLNSAFITKCMEEQYDDFNDINIVIKEWIEEALVITRILEMLRVVEPMTDVHEIEVPSNRDTIWSVMFGGTELYVRTMQAKDRCRGVLLRFENSENYRLPHRSQVRNDAWDAKYLAAKNRLADTWEDYFDGLREWVQEDSSVSLSLKAEAATLFEKIEDMTEPPAIVLPKRVVHTRASLVSKFRPVDSPSSSSDSIPHHYGPETPSARKLTKRKLANEARKYLRESKTEAEDETSVGEPADVDAEDGEQDDGSETGEEAAEVFQIPIKRRYLDVVQSLYSNAQEQVANVRWPRFERFMKDAGCSVRYNDNAVTFSGRNVVTGERKTCVIHRPHPDSTLYAVHLRNNRLHVQAAFGWTEEMFVER